MLGNWRILPKPHEHHPDAAVGWHGLFTQHQAAALMQTVGVAAVSALVANGIQRSAARAQCKAVGSENERQTAVKMERWMENYDSEQDSQLEALRNAKQIARYGLEGVNAEIQRALEAIKKERSGLVDKKAAGA
jgi:hypothetical protein